ncbi:MAG: ribbon-helix-helix protein, CopG family [Proteobacteria bacterium]|nr:ribbon-helix-helix protein, CopG family [Pseudomonadota bacterium]
MALIQEASRGTKGSDTSGVGRDVGAIVQEKERFSITLSPAAAKAFQELKEATDADTDTEVFRNALRLHISLLRAHKKGKKIYIEDENGKALVQVDLFAPM